MLLTVLSEIDFKYSTKKSENKDPECFFCKEKFSEDEQGEIYMCIYINMYMSAFSFRTIKWI